MPTRKEIAEQTKKTRQMLIDSALELTTESGFASISLRSVARKAGIAATSFYRHFRDMDELGVELVMEVEGVLQDYLEQTKTTCATLLNNAELDTPSTLKLGMICAIDTFLKVVKLNTDLFRFFSQAYTGSSQRIRKAVIDLLERFEGEFGAYIQDVAGFKSFHNTRIGLISQAVVSFLLLGGIALTSREFDADVIQERLKNQIQIYLTGAFHLNHQPASG